MQNTKDLNEIDNNNSSDSDTSFVQKEDLQRILIVDYSNEEEEEPTTRQSWIWQKVKNTPIVWKYSETHGKKRLF